QITGFTDNPRGAKIRYKLVQSHNWGAPVDGVSARVREDKIVWKRNETPSFRLDLRNQGHRDLITFQAQECGKLEVDAVWYEWTGPYDLKSSGFPPGREYEDIPITLTGGWKATQAWTDKTQSSPPPIPLNLRPGKHTIRFAPEVRDTAVKPK